MQLRHTHAYTLNLYITVRPSWWWPHWLSFNLHDSANTWHNFVRPRLNSFPHLCVRKKNVEAEQQKQKNAVTQTWQNDRLPPGGSRLQQPFINRLHLHKSRLWKKWKGAAWLWLEESWADVSPCPKACFTARWGQCTKFSITEPLTVSPGKTRKERKKNCMCSSCVETASVDWIISLDTHQALYKVPRTSKVHLIKVAVRVNACEPRGAPPRLF